MEFQPTINSNLIRGHIDTIILHALKDGDKYPQQICDVVLNISNGKYEINQATLYSSLKRLETLKFVSSYWHDADDGRRKFYSLTENGKNNLEENLLDWKFSKNIIDDLIGIKPENVETKIVTIEKPVYIEKIVEPTLSEPVIMQNFNKTEKIEEKQQEISNKTDVLVEKEPEKVINDEINYKSILGELVVNNVKQPEKEVVKPIKKQETLIKTVVKDSYSDEIERVSGVKSQIKSGSVDLSELKYKAKNEGYKLRISSEKNGLTTHSFYLNKVKLFSSFTLLLLVMLEFMFFALNYKNLFKITPVSIIIPAIFAILFPVINAINYGKNPQKISNKPFKKDSVFTVLIIVFNLILITFALLLLTNVNLRDLYSLLVYFVFPVTLYLDFFVYFLLKFAFAKNKEFKVKR